VLVPNSGCGKNSCRPIGRANHFHSLDWRFLPQHGGQLVVDDFNATWLIWKHAVRPATAFKILPKRMA
jgi:hypothetical protein